MPARLRKLVGALVILLWVLVYVAVAAAIGDRLKNSPWWAQLIYFPLAGLLWIVPLRPLLKWLHAKDGPSQSPDV
jgi:membrane protein implicated in regulation of membrane protease activity